MQIRAQVCLQQQAWRAGNRSCAATTGVVQQARQLGYFAGDIVRWSAKRRHKLCFVASCLLRAGVGFSGGDLLEAYAYADVRFVCKDVE